MQRWVSAQSNRNLQVKRYLELTKQDLGFDSHDTSDTCESVIVIDEQRRQVVFLCDSSGSFKIKLLKDFQEMDQTKICTKIVRNSGTGKWKGITGKLYFIYYEVDKTKGKYLLNIVFCGLESLI